MARWLYNSDGDPIAFISRQNVFTRRGAFLGRLYEDNTVWNNDYVGELYADDRLIYDERTLHGTRGAPGLPGLPEFTGEPAFKDALSLPLGFVDIRIGR